MSRLPHLSAVGLLFAGCLLSVAAFLTAPASAESTSITLSSPAGAISFNATNGSILTLSQAGRTGSMFQSSTQGLWQIRFQDGTTLCATNFAAGSAENSFTAKTDPAANSVQMQFHNAELTVSVTATIQENHVDFSAQLQPVKKTILDFALPARLRFDPGQIDRFICPATGGNSVGTAFRRSFFEPQPQDHPAAWRTQSIGPKGYISLYGAGLNARPMKEPPVALTVTATGRDWLGTGLTKRLETAQASVTRPPAKGQADLILVDSPSGPYFSASHLGGSGSLWRIGGFVDEHEMKLTLPMIRTTIEKLSSTPPADRQKIAVIALAQGPQLGSGSTVRIQDWLEAMRKLPAVTQGKVTLLELKSPAEMMETLQARDILAILNPYGEALPTVGEDGMPAAIAAIGKFVREGGHWFEVGGYSFHATLRPVRFFSFSSLYPPAFADFLHGDTQAGSWSLYGVQPQKWPAWAGAKNPEAIFVPGRIGCGADESGGYCERAFGTFVAPGQSWHSPVVRLTIGKAASDDLLAYCEANQISRRLDQKMSADVLAKFKQAVLVFLSGSCPDKIACLDRLPVPTLIHFSDFLKGGFDKEYPDHLPPRPQFGTPAEFRQFIDRSHALGHLIMPYTNPTWWCDHPKGPTFEREGDVPLLHGFDGKPVYERYSTNDGWTVCHWHPAVQAANRKTVREFSEDYPSDLIFQDQCGARTWHYDTNPASPTPYAYADGMASMTAEDCQKKPLSTENGWDRVVNYEAQLCGLSWQIVPTEGGPAWRHLMKYEYPPSTWELYPIVQQVAHEKCSLLYHDLGQFVTTREVLSWTLGLGFGMSYRTTPTALTKDTPREWLGWLDRLQKSVCSRYVGEPMKSFVHQRDPKPTVEDDGVLRATYGPVDVIANLGPNPKLADGHALPAFGFYCKSPAGVAANLEKIGPATFDGDGVSFVTEGDAHRAEVWVYGIASQDVAVELPAGMKGEVAWVFDTKQTGSATVKDGTVSFQLPQRPATEPAAAKAGSVKYLWHAVVSAK